MSGAAVKVGYKQTEVGVIPEDWEVKRLGEIATVTAGGTPCRKNLAYWDGHIPWITTSQIEFGTITSAEQWITEEGLKNSPAKLLPVGTLLMALYGQGKTRGKTGVLGLSAATNQACAAITIGRSVSREFVFHFLASRYDAIRNLSNSGSQENLNGKIVRSIPIPIPTEFEGMSIASALSDMDALISGLDQLIAKKRNLKQAAMQQLLTGQRRLLGYESKSGFKQTEVGLIPKDWNVGIIKDHTSIGTGNRNTQDRIDTGLYPFFVRSQVIERINSFSFEGEAVLTAGDGVGTGKVFHYIRGRFDFHQRVYKISDFSEFLDGFYFFLYFSNHFYDRIMSMTAKSSVDSVRMEMIANMFIPLPTFEEQRSITAVFSDMDAELTALEARRDKTRDLKQGMMQELLTGRIRLV